MFSKGPVTPDHVIRIKAKPLILKNKKNYSNTYLKNALTKYVLDYKNILINIKIILRILKYLIQYQE